MLMKASDLRRLPLVDLYLREQQYEKLETLVEAEAAQGLLDSDTLASARALNLVPTVIYLATLGLENLADPGDRALWVEIYRTLGRKTETEGFQELPNHLPLKWVVQSVISGKAPDLKALQRCRGKPDDWQAAYELVVDQHHFELAEHMTTHLLEQKLPVDAWLQITGMLVERQSLLVSSRESAPLARSLIRICKRLPVTPLLRTTRSTLALQAALYFQQAGEHAKAIRTVDLVVDPIYQVPKMSLLAESNCHLGKLPLSIEWIDRLLRATGTRPFKDWLDKSRNNNPTSHTFDPVLAGQALAALQDALDRSGQKVFLVSGTLLGYAREGKLLAHDKDIDVGVLHWQSQFDVALALLESRQFVVDTRTMIGTQTYLLPIKHIDTGTDIDVFIYHPEDDKLVTGVQSQFGYLQKFAFTPFGLKEVDFLGIKTHVPDDVDRNLTENFGGGWRVSDPGYISHLESPSTVDVGGLVYQLVGRQNCILAIRKGNKERLLRALDCMEREHQKPCGMAPELIQQLRAFGETLAKPQVMGTTA